MEENHGKMRTAARHLLSLIGSTLQGRRLLLVEDNDLNAEIAATILEGDGAYVSIAGDGAQAVEAFAANPAGTFDAILMDVVMPKMDSLAATRAIRALDRPDAATIPIIAMTGNAFQEDVQECLEAGMNAHIAKPIDMTKAERVIAKVVGEGPPPIKELEIDQYYRDIFGENVDFPSLLSFVSIILSLTYLEVKSAKHALRERVGYRKRRRVLKRNVFGFGGVFGPFQHGEGRCIPFLGICSGNFAIAG